MNIPETKCREGWELRAQWYVTKRPAARMIYENHLRNCPYCMAEFRAVPPGYETRTDDEIAAACGIPVELRNAAEVGA